MAKFLSCEDRLEIESCLKAHMTFTEIGKKLGRDRTVGIPLHLSASSVNPSVTVAVDSMRKKSACIGSNRPMPVTAAGGKEVHAHQDGV